MGIWDGSKVRLYDVPLASSPQLLIDLGVPRNIDPALATEHRRVVNIDAFAPTYEFEEALFDRSWRDYGVLTARMY